MPKYKINVSATEIRIPVNKDLNGLNSCEPFDVSISWEKAIYYSAEVRFMYSSHSIGRECFFLLLHSLQAGTTLPLVDLPPRIIGIKWSMVIFLGEKVLLQ